MPKKYPVGIQDFSELRSGNYVYVDKTPFVYKLIDEGKYYFLSRPRRFGKSLFVSTLDYLFQGKKELFDGLYITDKWDWTKINPVIKISFSNIDHKKLGLNIAINTELLRISEEFQIVLKSTTSGAMFRELIEKLATKIGKVVVLIDEYDKPIIDYLGQDIKKALENQDVMKGFYAILKDADPYLKLVFITGVSKFSRVSIFSDLNNLTDLTIDGVFSGVCGITQQELESNFTEELNNFDPIKIKEWYNGYTWDLKTNVYNPFSLLHFFRTGEYKNYWFETGTPTFLVNLTKKAQLYDFENREITLNQLSSYDIEKLHIIPLMFQTGYLTFKSYNETDRVYILDYPNSEVQESYIEILANSYIDNEDKNSISLAIKIRNTLQNNDLEKLQAIFNSLFKSIPYTLWQKENEHFYHAIIHLIFKLLGFYIQSEVQSSDGRLDAIVFLEKHIYCFEFKLNGSADEALQQIKDNGYLLPYQYEEKQCIAIGVNFSKELKQVEAIKWEIVENV